MIEKLIKKRIDKDYVNNIVSLLRLIIFGFIGKRTSLITIFIILIFVFPYAHAVEPKGFLDSADCSTFQGWTCDPDKYGESLDVHFYKDGPAGGGGTLIDSTTASGNRPDVSSVCGGTTNHGFIYSTPSSLKDGSQHTIYAYAINTPPGTNPQLSGSPIPIECAPPDGTSCTTCSGGACSTGNCVWQSGACVNECWNDAGTYYASTCSSNFCGSGTLNSNKKYCGSSDYDNICCSSQKGQSCGNCGTVACDGTCQNQGVCSPGSTQSCSGGTQTCTSSCSWGVCESNDPKGFVDGVNCDIIKGWTCDANNYDAALDVRLIVDGVEKKKTWAGWPREQAVANKCGGNPNQGFSFVTPGDIKDGKTHSVEVKAIGWPPGSDTTFSGTLQCDAPSYCGTVCGEGDLITLSPDENCKVESQILSVTPNGNLLDISYYADTHVCSNPVQSGNAMFKVEKWLNGKFVSKLDERSEYRECWYDTQNGPPGFIFDTTPHLTCGVDNQFNVYVLSLSSVMRHSCCGNALAPIGTFESVIIPGPACTCNDNGVCEPGLGEDELNCPEDCGESPLCTSQSYSQCYNGDRYWYDSCDNREGIRESCSSGCSGDTCITGDVGSPGDVGSCPNGGTFYTGLFPISGYPVLPCESGNSCWKTRDNCDPTYADGVIYGWPDWWAQCPIGDTQVAGVGTCGACSNPDYSSCDTTTGDIYWYDGCTDAKKSLKEACAAGCSGDSCNPEPQPEICDGIDNDLNGIIDDNCDSDNDDYCDAGITRSGPYACSGTTQCCGLGGNDCNDNNANIHPGQTELVTCAVGTESTCSFCTDGFDNDCDGLKDSDDPDCVPSCTIISRECKQYTEEEFNIVHDALGTNEKQRFLNKKDNNFYTCEPDTTDSACCDNPNSCVYDGTCYDDRYKGDVDNDGIIEICVASSPGEWVEDFETDCSNGIDDDFDGLTDCEDPDCDAVLKGTIADSEDGSALPGAKVQVFDTDLNLIDETSADINGYYEFSSLKCGTRNIVASMEDYVPGTEADLAIAGRSENTQDFGLVFGQLCEDDCTFAIDNIIHAGCDGINGCSFYDGDAAAACENAQPGWVRDYPPDTTQVIDCAEGSPRPKVDEEAIVTCSEGNLIKLTKIVTYQGKPVKLVVVTCG